MIDNTNEYIVCAAIWYNDTKKRQHLPINVLSGIVISGLRHSNCISVLKELFPDENYKDRNRTIQGFLTSKGNFVDRKQAAEIALKSGQITKNDNCLFSENLY